VIAIIPARGGSKRIPKKNIKLFFGKPIISWVIENALQSGLFSSVFVSTDDAEIASIAKQHGAEVPVLRSPENSDDFATTADVLTEVLAWLQKNNRLPDSFCCIYPTSPLIDAQDLNAAYSEFSKNNTLVLVSAVPYSFPVQRSFRLGENQLVKPIEPESMSKRSQDLELTYHDAGSFYFFETSFFLEKKEVWTDHTKAYLLDELKVQDIDTETDWKLAELKYQLLKG
jgi:pseudaminic acid cytidylyltransferase